MKKDTYIQNFLKEIAGEQLGVSADELRRAEAHSEDLHHEGQNIKHVCDVTDSYKTNVNFDSKKAFSKFLDKVAEETEVKASNPEVKTPTPTKIVHLPRPEAKIVAISRRFILSTAAACLLFLVSGWFMFSGGDTKLKNNTNSIEKHILADGSQIALFPNSSVAFSSDFSKPNRTVSLTKGRVLFDIQKASSPFVVVVQGNAIEVTGTMFSVENLDLLRINLFEGSVKYTTNKETIACSAGNSILHDTSTGVVSKLKSVDNSILDAVNGKLYFENVRLDQVFKRLSQFFNVAIVSYSEEINNLHFTSTQLEGQELSTILKTIEVSFGIVIEQSGSNTYTVGDSTNQ